MTEELEKRVTEVERRLDAMEANGSITQRLRDLTNEVRACKAIALAVANKAPA